MRSTGNPFKANSLEMNEFPNQKMKKKIIRLYIKLASFFKLHVEQWLSSFHQWLSWTSVGPLKCPINKTMRFRGHLMFRTVPWMQHDINKRLFKSLFFRNEWIRKQAMKKIPLLPQEKLVCFFKLLVDQRLQTFHQLFSWISVESSK